MTNRNPKSNRVRRDAESRRASPSPSRGRRVRVEPTRRQPVDADLIALCYWLLAQRIVEQADDPTDPVDAADGRDEAPAADPAAGGAS